MMFSRCYSRWTPCFFAQPEAAAVVSAIPQQIHFIWAGGTRIIPQASLRNILRWRQQNPSYTICLWVDHTSSLDLEAEYQQEMAAGMLPPELNFPFVFRDIEELRAQIAQIPAEEAAVLSQVLEIARYEMTKSYANYGKSSDLLRYLILYLEGGIYLDSDVVPNQGNFSQFLLPQPGPDVLWVDANSQGQGAVGNDAFAVTPRHPFFLTVLQYALLNYTTLFDEGLETSGNTHFLRELLQANTIYFLEDRTYRMESTIGQTGLTFIRAGLRQSGLLEVSDVIPTLGFACFPDVFKRVELENARSWFQSQQPNDKPYEICLRQAANAIQFEVNTLRWLRVVDHVKYILEHTFEAELPPEGEIVHDLLERLAAMDLNYPAVRVVQVGYLTRQLTVFYEQQVPEQYRQAKQHFFPGEDPTRSPLQFLEQESYEIEAYVTPDDEAAYCQLLQDYMAHYQGRVEEE